MPDTMVPRNPEDKITISTIGKDVIVWNVSDIAMVGCVKYSPIVLFPTIIEITNGYKMDINHVRRNNIFKIKANPKNMTKYNITDTIS